MEAYVLEELGGNFRKRACRMVFLATQNPTPSLSPCRIRSLRRFVA